MSKRTLESYLGWIEPVGPGAYKKYSDTIDWQAGVHAIQNQLNLPIHPGGRTALELLGYAHYTRFKDRVFLFCKTGETLPKWFRDAGWKKAFAYHQTRLFLFFSERNELPWLVDLNLHNVNLGSGKRVIVKNGKYNTKYQISIPEIKDL